VPGDVFDLLFVLKLINQKMLTGAREAYDAFLERYPYCYGYWKKYADLEKHNGSYETTEQVHLSTFLSFVYLVFKIYTNFLVQVYCSINCRKL